MNTRGLHNLARAIGWVKVNEEEEYTSYEYRTQLSPKEAIVNVVRVYNEVTIDEFLETLYILKNVLPKKLLKRVNKITNKLKPENILGALDAVCFAIDEYKTKCDYTKLCEYASIIGIDLKERGYGFQYEIDKRTYKQILTLIESNLPMQDATRLAKMKRLDYKIGYLKSHHIQVEA